MLQVQQPYHPQPYYHHQPPAYPNAAVTMMEYGYHGYPTTQGTMAGHYATPIPSPFRGGGGDGSGGAYNHCSYPQAGQQQLQPYIRGKKKKRKRYLTKGIKNLYVAMDCEFVGIGEYGAKSALARVTLLDWKGKIVMDELVKPQSEVTDYRTFVSGITKEMLDRATMDFATAQKLVLHHLAGKILVGHGLSNDLQVLGITHPLHRIRDTASFKPFMRVCPKDKCTLLPRSLKDLCAEKLEKEIQVYGRPHCPKEDAAAALDLYKMIWRYWEDTIDAKMRL